MLEITVTREVETGDIGLFARETPETMSVTIGRALDSLIGNKLTTRQKRARGKAILYGLLAAEENARLTAGRNVSDVQRAVLGTSPVAMAVAYYDGLLAAKSC